MNNFGLMVAACTVAQLAHTVLLTFDRAVDPGRCATVGRCCNAGRGWPAIPTRRSLDCATPRKPSRPPGPSERTAWAKRRTLIRKAERAFVATLGHRVGAPWDY